VDSRIHSHGPRTTVRRGNLTGADMGAMTIDRPLRLLVLALVLCALGLFAAAERSSATVLCKTATDPCTGGTYGNGTTFEASLKTGTKSVLDAPFGSIECSESSLKGQVTGTGGENSNASGTLSTFAFKNCNGTVSVSRPGTFIVKFSGGNNGVLVLEGFETTVKYEGLHCIYSGSIEIFLKGGAMASIGSVATLTRTGGDPGCGTLAGWTVDYTIAAPEPLYVAEKEKISTVLCKTATDPCTGGTYGKGTTIEASLRAGTKSVLDAPFGSIECSESSLKGEVTAGGGEGEAAHGTLTAWSLSSCNATVSILKRGVFTIKSPKAGSGTLMLEGFEITVSYLGTHCIFSESMSVPLKGGGMSSIGTSATAPRTGGGSGVFCGSTVPWTVDYTVTAPEPLYVAEKAEELSTVLCKTATNPCTGGTYGKSTTIKASLKSGTKSVLDPPFGAIECSQASIESGVTNAGGGEGPVVTGTINSLSFSSCNATVTVLKKGSFSIASTGGGTLVLEDFETTVQFIGTHCIYSGSVSLLLKGGSMASIGTSVTMNRTGGTSGAFCGSTAQWTVDYTVTAPEPLYVAET